ncbi:hypothetical protein D3C85_1151050 [compost metagenome]
MNANALKHPRTAWSIEAACWRAIKYGAAIARNAAGGEIVTVVHDRGCVPGIMFYRDCVDVTESFTKALRASINTSHSSAVNR